MTNHKRAFFIFCVCACWLLALQACSSGPTSDNGDGSTPAAGTDAVPQPGGEAAASPDTAPPPPDAQAQAPVAPAPIDGTSSVPTAEVAPPAAMIPAAPEQGPAPVVADGATGVAAPAPVVAPVAPTPDVAAVAPVAPIVAQEETAPEVSPVTSSGEYKDYTVHSGETLMHVAFENYGDVYRWKEIYQANRDRISDPNHVPGGTVLKLEKTSFVYKHHGEKYLIKSGDTLGLISDDVYGTKIKWRRIWKNNQQLIHNPNRIFAGFQIYYTMTHKDREDLERYRQMKGAPLAKDEPPQSRDPSSIDAPSPMQAQPQAQAPAPSAPMTVQMPGNLMQQQQAPSMQQAQAPAQMGGAQMPGSHQ